MTLALFALASLIESMGWGHISVFTPIYLRELHVSASGVPFWTGILGSVGTVIGFPLLPFWGAWAERFGRKAIIVRSAVIEAVIYAVAALAQNPYELMVARAMSGFVMGNTGVMMAVQSEISPAARVGLAIASIAAGPSLAVAIGPLFGGFVAAGPGLRTLFWIDSALSVLSSLTLIVLLKEEVRERTSKRTATIAFEAVRDVVTIAPVRTLFIIFFLFGIGVSGIQTFYPIWFHEVWQAARGTFLGRLPLTEALGIVVGMAGFAMGVATPLLGWVGDRIGTLRVLGVALWGNALGLMAQGLFPSLAGVAAGRLGQGVFQGGVSANVSTMLVRVTPPERRSSVMNLAILPQQIAWFVAPISASALVASVGLDPMILIMGAIALAGAVLGAFLLPRLASAVPQRDL